MAVVVVLGASELELAYRLLLVPLTRLLLGLEGLLPQMEAQLLQMAQILYSAPLHLLAAAAGTISLGQILPEITLAAAAPVEAQLERLAHLGLVILHQ
ncbi:MAG: hypothetical protein EBR82_47830 [Caulobacteraceae bacterium]|nr:hypothetical protein [Caulobacteraceae bacterium]